MIRKEVIEMQMKTLNVTTPGTSQNWNQFIKWSGLSGVVAPILFVLLFTAAGSLRPGYSAISQAISDLGVGPMAWLVNIPIVILGLLVLALAVGFFLAMQPVMSEGWRWTSAVLTAIPGLGLAAGGIFSEAPSTLVFHILLGATLGLYFPVVTFFLVGLQLVRNREWRGFGIYSLIASLATIAIIVFMQQAFTPGSALAGFHIAGLAERVDLVEILAWYVIMGWRLFRLPQKG
jgi:hypothetical membrane protein